MEHVRMEGVRGWEKGKGIGIMCIQKDVEQGRVNKGTRSFVNFMRITLEKSRLKLDVNTHRK